MKFAKCPVCSRHLRTENLPMHVETCLTRQQHNESTNQSPVAIQRRAQNTEDGLLSPLGSEPSNMANPAKASISPQGFQRANQLIRQEHVQIQQQQLEVQQQLQQLQHSSPETNQLPQKKKRKLEQSSSSTPLADQMRPKTIHELVGQDDLLAPGTLLRTLIEADRVPNMILWGPPGCGKTTLAHIISKCTDARFITISGTNATVAAVKDAVEKARGEKRLINRRTILFVDEIHRFKSNQQDVFLPLVEDGTITLIGATTENPSFVLNNALLSRCKVHTLKALDLAAIIEILRRAVAKHTMTMCKERDDHHKSIQVDDDAIEFLAKQSGGDARVALNSLEMVMQAILQTEPQHNQSISESSKEPMNLTKDAVVKLFSRKGPSLYYDRNGDFHYDCISAFHKSIRGSDANAALYWLGRMLESGENPLYVARRLIRVASEDIGVADPFALPLAVSAYQAAHFIGMPECNVVLAHCTTVLARAPKSVEVYKAYKRVKQTIEDHEGRPPQVPLHLRNAPTRLMQDLGYGKDYKYNPDYAPEELTDQTYLPEELLGTDFFEDTKPVTNLKPEAEAVNGGSHE